MIADHSLPELNDRDLAVKLAAMRPATEILIHTVINREGTLHVLNTDSADCRLAAVESLARHRPDFSPEGCEIVLSHMHNRRKERDDALSHREREIVQRVAEGKINKKSAHMLSISMKTVESHRASVMMKLNVHTTADLVRYAVRSPLVAA